MTKPTAKAEQLLAQCDECLMIKVQFKGAKTTNWQYSIVQFNHLPVEKCPVHVIHRHKTKK